MKRTKVVYACDKVGIISKCLWDGTDRMNVWRPGKEAAAWLCDGCPECTGERLQKTRITLVVERVKPKTKGGE